MMSRAKERRVRELGHAGRVEVSDADRMAGLFGLDAEDAKHFKTACAAADENGELAALVSALANDISAGIGAPGRQAPEWPEPYPTRSEVGSYDPVNAFFELVVFAQCLGPLLAYYDAVRVPPEIAAATLSDVGRTVRETREILDARTLREREWLSLHFQGVLFEVGRLQYERIAAADERMTESCPYRGEVALDLHVPGGGPLLPDDVAASFTDAAKFFTERFPHASPTVVRCASWLLDPQGRDYLPEHSNIVQFQENFKLSYIGPDPDNMNIVQYVFKRRGGDVRGIIPTNTLQRAVLDHIRDGRAWQIGLGWMRLPTTN